MKFIRLRVAIVAVVVAACTSPMPSAAPSLPGATPTVTTEGLRASAQDDVTGLIGRTFIATRVIDNGQAIEIIAGTQILVSFADASHFGASAGCNRMGGDFEIRDGRLMTANVVMTAMGCLGELGRQEGRFFQFLQSDPTISRHATGLVMSAGEAKITFVEEATP